MNRKRKILLLAIGFTLALGSCKNEEEEVIAAPTPTKLEFTNTAHANLTESSCALVTVQAQTAANAAFSATTAIDLALVATNGSFYSDSACSTLVTTATIAVGASSVDLYYGSKTNGTDTVTASSTGLTSGTQGAITAISFVGTWKNTCTQDPDSTSDYLIDTLVLNADSSAVWTQNIYYESTCTTVGQKLVMSANWVIGALSTSVTDARRLTFTVTKFEFTIYGGTVSVFNGGSFFGFTDWADSVTKDVTGISSGAAAGNFIVSAGDVGEDLYKISNSQYINSTKVSSFSTTVPTTINDSVGQNTFTKQ